MDTRQVNKSIAYLCKIIDAGEKGYAVSALNVKNSALRVLFKSFALQRARFLEEIRVEMLGTTGGVDLGNSFRGMVHRGRINIFGALIIEHDERERMVLNEILLGEKVALEAYQKALRQDLPQNIRRIVERQFLEVEGVVEQIHILRGRDRKRELVFIYDSPGDVEKIMSALRKAGFPVESVGRTSLDDFSEVYLPVGQPVRDTFLSGAVGGALWGCLIGALAGLGALQSTGSDPLMPFDPQTMWAIIAMCGIAGGALVGGVLGYFIGLGAKEEDSYQYKRSMDHGHTMLHVLVNESHARQAGLIMSRTLLLEAAGK